MISKRTPLLEVMERELERIRYNPAYRFLLFAGPLLGILVLFFIFYQGTVKKLPVAVVDQDNSSLSLKMNTALDAASDIKVVMHAPDMFHARKMLKKGRVDAVIWFPKDMEQSVLQGLEVSVPVYINGTNILKAGFIQRSVLTTLNTVSAGIQLNKLMLDGKNKQQAMARVMPVKIQKHVLFNPFTNYSYFLNSAMLYVMLYLFVFLSSIYTLGNELKRGTGVGLLETSNGSVRLAVVGKLFPYTIIFTGFAMLINLLLFQVDGMPLQGSYLLIFFGQFITIVTYQFMGLIFIGVTINLRLALSLGSAYSMMAITFSGLTFPLEAMPAIARGFAVLFPFTWWEKLIISQALRGAPIAEALPYLCYILCFLLFSLCFLKTYKRYLSNSKYWGKA